MHVSREKRGSTKAGSRIGLLSLITLVLVLILASAAFAAQNPQISGGGADDNIPDFAATPKVSVPDGTTNYPAEIYLPNEGNPKDYRIHSNYSATTDACATCHSTHTAVGETLLQWSTVYDACMACHDGTVTTTYDVKHGLIGNTGSLTSAGLFGDGTEPSASNHDVSGALTVSAAPGASPDPDPNYSSEGAVVSWDIEFGCQSCHSPHGQGGNARLLSPDPNGVGWAKYNKGDNATAGGSQKVPVTLDGLTGTTDYNQDGQPDRWVLGWPYPNTVYYLDDQGNKQPLYPAFDNSSGVKTVLTFKEAPISQVYADFVPGLVVRMDVVNYLSANETVTHISGLNDFCGACHTKYNNSPEGFGHPVGVDASFAQEEVNLRNMKLESGNVSCETCHVAHGINENYWNATLPESVKLNFDANGNPVVGPETTGSSSLKRLPNNGTCVACHPWAE